MVHGDIWPAAGLEAERVVLVDDVRGAVSGWAWREDGRVHVGTRDLDVRLGGRDEVPAQRHLGDRRGWAARTRRSDDQEYRVGAGVWVSEVSVLTRCASLS